MARPAGRPSVPSPAPSITGLTAALTGAMGVGPFVMYTLTVLSVYIVDDLDLTRTQFGSLATVGFLTAAVTSLILRRSSDRVPSHIQMHLTPALGLAALLVLMTTRGFTLAVLAVVLSGLAQALSTPVTNRIVATSVTRRQGQVIGIKQSGVQVAQVVAAGVLPAVAHVAGWRPAVGAAAVVVLGCLVLTVAFVPAADRRPSASASASTGVSPARLPAAIWWLCGYSFVMGAALQGTQVHLPLFASEDLAMSPTVAASVPIVAGVVGVASRLAWGRAVDVGVTPHTMIAILSALAVLAGGLNLAASSTETAWILWVSSAVFGLSALATNGVVMLAVVRETAARQQVGTATGVVAAGLFAGFGAGPVAFGALVDATGGYAWSLRGVTALYVASLLIAVEWARQSSRGLRGSNQLHGTIRHPVASLESQRYRSLLDGRWVEFARLCHPDFVYTHSDGRVDTLATYARKLHDGHYEFESFDHPIERLWSDGRTCLVWSRVTSRMRAGAQQKSLDNQLLTVWVRRSWGRWRLLAQHPLPAGKR